MRIIKEIYGITQASECSHWTSLVAQMAKNLPAVQEIWVQSWVGKIPWRRERLPTPVFWPGEFHGLCSPWGHKESDTTEPLSLSGHLLQLKLIHNDHFI